MGLQTLSAYDRGEKREGLDWCSEQLVTESFLCSCVLRLAPALMQH